MKLFVYCFNRDDAKLLIPSIVQHLGPISLHWNLNLQLWEAVNFILLTKSHGTRWRGPTIQWNIHQLKEPFSETIIA